MPAKGIKYWIKTNRSINSLQGSVSIYNCPYQSKTLPCEWGEGEGGEGEGGGDNKKKMGNNKPSREQLVNPEEKKT